MTPLQITSFRSAFSSATVDEPMSKHTSFRIGGPARLFLSVSSADELVRAVLMARELDVSSYVFGGGSNLLVSDAGFDGVMIQAALRNLSVDGTIVRADCGVITALAARKSVEAGLTGFEWASGVPGTIGGAIYGDAGCYGGEMRDSVLSVDVVRLSDGKRLTLTKEECRFEYRDSLFKHEPHLILSCELQLTKSADPSASLARIATIMQERKEKQPLDQSSAGCIFRNVDFVRDEEIARLSAAVTIPPSMLSQKRLAAGWLIDKAGMLGEREGEVTVSEKHGNFFLNAGHAKATDIVALIARVKSAVREKFGLELHEEVQLVGF